MGKRKVYNQSRMRSNKRSNKRSTKRKSNVKRTNTYRIKKSKKKTHRRKYNKSLKKTIKGGEGLTGIVAAGIGLGAVAAGVHAFRNYRRNNEVTEFDDIKHQGSVNPKSTESIPNVKSAYSPAAAAAAHDADLPGLVQSNSGEPKSKGEKYKDLLLDESMKRIWPRYCPHYTPGKGYNGKGYNIKKYKPNSQGEWVEHEVRRIEWMWEPQSNGWTYIGTETNCFSNGQRDVWEDDQPLDIKRDWSELEELDGIDQLPNYQILERLLSSDGLAIEQARLYLTKGTILKSKTVHASDWIHGDFHKYIVCSGIFWSPIENTWRVIYGYLSDKNRLLQSDDSQESGYNYNIKLDGFKSNIFEEYNIFGFNNSYAYKKLKESVGFTVNIDDYLFRGDKLIRIIGISWSIDEQTFLIRIFNYETCAEDEMKFGLDNIEIIGYSQIQKIPNYGCFKTFTKTEGHLIRKTTTLKITNISYNQTEGKFNYTISIDLKSDGNAVSVPMLEDELEAYIKRNNYNPQYGYYP